MRKVMYGLLGFLMLASVISFAQPAQNATIKQTTVQLRDAAGKTFNEVAFQINFTHGAVWACTIFRMVEPTEKNSEVWPDGHYAPRSCGPVSKTANYFIEPWNPYIRDPQTGKDYDVEWEVYAFVQHPIGNNNDDFTYTETPRIRYRR